MALSRKEIEALLRLVGLTKDVEIGCDECLSRIAEFAEQQLQGRSVAEGLKAVEHHLSVCAECREEYGSLRKALEALDE